MSLLDAARVGFFERVRTRAWVGRIAAGWPRVTLAMVVAAIPGALLFALSVWGPPSIIAAVTRAVNIHDTFGRFITGTITASSIAVSVAVLTLQGEMRGLNKVQERQAANDSFREDTRELLGDVRAPILLGSMVEETLRAIAEQARVTRERAADHLSAVHDGTRLGDLLDVTEARSRSVADAIHPVRTKPDTLHLRFLDMEHEVLLALARRHGRNEELPDHTRAELQQLHDLLARSQMLMRYTKSLDVQWGLSRMSHTILAATIPAVLVAASMTLLLDAGTIAALGRVGTAAVVSVALSLVLFPLAAFTSHLVRFIFLNQHTLATYGFVLGPEAPATARPTQRGP